MTTDNAITSAESVKSPIGKVIGVVETRAQLQAVSEALSKLGVQEFDVLEGTNGINHLEDDQAAVARCFLGDMEAEMVRCYLDAVKAGRIVFAARVESEVADQAAETAKARGASDVVHFGVLVITNY